MIRINQELRSRRQMHILVITSTYPRHDGDYAVPWLRESVKQLVARGHRVTVLAPSFEGLGNHEIDRVPVYRFRYFPARWEHLTHEQGAPNRIRNPLYQILGLPYVIMGMRAAIRLARQIPFDVVHVHWPFPHGQIGMAAARACGAPLVMTNHGAEFMLARKKPWIRPLLRHALLHADLLIANSSWTANEVKLLSGREAIVLPFGSTVKGFKLQTPENPVPRILFTGRLIQRKGVEYLLRAAPCVLAHQPVEFVIIGDGDQRSNLEELSRSLGLQNSVRFLGFVSNEQLDAAYAACDLWVNPAIIDDYGDTEGLGVGAIEAYMHNKSVVASAVGGIPDVVKHGVTGLLVPQRNEKRLAEAIIELLDDPKKAAQLAETGLRFAQEAFNWDHITERLEKMYYDLLAVQPGLEIPPDIAENYECQAANDFSTNTNIARRFG